MQAFRHLFTERNLIVREEENDPCDYSCSAGGGYRDNDRLAPDLVRGERLITLNNLARETGVPAQQLALAWLLNSWRFQDRPMIIPLFSASRLETLQDNIAACDVQLGNEVWAALNEA